MGFYSSGSSGQFKNLSGYGKFVDVLMRPTYASAGIAEYLMGRSPYKGLGSAAWGGFSGQRKTTYGTLTGDPISGFVLDVALDPTTYIPFGAIPRLARAARLPAAMSKAAGALGTKVPALGSAGRKLATAGKVLFSDPAYKAKVALGMIEAERAVKGIAGVSDDILTAARFGKLEKSAIFKAPEAAREPLRMLNHGARFLNGLESLPFRQQLAVERTARRYKKLAGKWEKLEKAEPEKTRAFLDALERRVPVKGASAGAGRVYLSVSDDFIKDVRALGVSDDVIIATRANAKKLVTDLPVFDDIEQMVGRGLNEVDLPNLLHISSEYDDLMREALKGLAPEYGEVYRFARQVNGRLADIIASKSDYYKNVMQNFQREIGLGHLPHEWKNLKDQHAFLKRVAVERRATIEGKVSQAKAQLRTVLEQAKKAGTKEQVEEIQELIKRLDGFKDEALEKLFGKRGNFIDFMDEIHQTGKRFNNTAISGAYRDFERIIGKSFGEMRTVAGTIEGIEALGREAGFKKLLETNIAKLLYAEETKLKSVLLYHNYIKRMQSEFPDLIKVAKKGAAAPEGAVKVSAPIMGDFFVHKDIADMFGNILKVGSGKGDPLIDVAKYFDRFYSSMKYYMIVPFAKTGIRNFVSSVSLTSLSLKPGEVPAYMSSLYRATKLWNKAKRGDKAAMGMYQKMMRGGLLETFYRAEFAMGTKGLTPKYPNFGLGGVGRAIEGTKVGGAAAKVATPAFRTAMGGMATFYESTEMIPRMAMYLFAKDKPAAWFHRFGVKNVIDYVRKFQPSYSKLTPFERKYMNRIFMFYSWPRHNIPLHIEMIINNPGHYANLEKLRRAGTEILGGELPEYFEPEYIRKGYAVGLKGHGANKKTYFLLRGWAPEADLESVMSIQSFRDLFSGMFNPMVKTPLEVGYGYDMFKKKKLPAYPGEKVPFYGMRVDPRIPHMLSFMRAVQETNRFWFNRTDPFMTRCMYALLGKTYTVDVEKARRYFKHHGGVVIGEIDHGIERAKKERDFDTVKRLTAQKHKIEQSLKGL